MLGWTHLEARCTLSAVQIPSEMFAAVLERFGTPAELKYRRIPVPRAARGEVLIRVRAAGVGRWDAFEREGGYAQMLGSSPRFPYVLGSEGAGIVAALGEGVEGVAEGDLAIAVGFLNPRGGFYAEYSVASAELVQKLPPGLTLEQGAAVAGVGITALRGLDDVLHVRRGDRILILGASGGVGHLALQIAKARGAFVLAIASGTDGVALCERLGADVALDGRSDDCSRVITRMEPMDVGLFAAGGEVARQALTCIRSDGRIAYPNGVSDFDPTGDDRITAYNGEPDAEIMRRLRDAICEHHVTVHVGGAYTLRDARSAHCALERHFLGKLVLLAES